MLHTRTAFLVERYVRCEKAFRVTAGILGSVFNPAPRAACHVCTCPVLRFNKMEHLSRLQVSTQGCHVRCIFPRRSILMFCQIFEHSFEYHFHWYADSCPLRPSVRADMTCIHACGSTVVYLQRDFTVGRSQTIAVLSHSWTSSTGLCCIQNMIFTHSVLSTSSVGTYLVGPNG
jgi:hypothetical protein